MKALFTILVTLWLVLAAAALWGLASAADLRSFRLATAGEMPCTKPHEPHQRTVRKWTNDTGAVVHVRQIQYWDGFDDNDVAGLDTEVVRDDGEYVAYHGYEHYAPQNLPTTQVFNYEPDSIDLQPGESLTLFAYCVYFYSPPTNTPAHAFVSVVGLYN